MKIGDGIVQVLRWYSDTSKQNFRKSWIRNGLMKHNLLVSPDHSVLPFQLRRYASLSVVTVLDLYDENDNFVMNVLGALPAPATDHIRIYGVGHFNNIVFYQKAALSQDMPCGAHYLHLSDGTNNWYSELFAVVSDFKPITQSPLFITSEMAGIAEIFTINNSGTPLYMNNLPY